MRVLVPVDESASSAEIVKAISAQIRPQNAKVRVLHVLQPIAGSVPPQMSPGYKPELEPFVKPAKDLLAKTAENLRAAGFKVEAVLKKGDIRETIIDSAEEWNADLIVLGSPDHNGAHRFLLGSVPESVARYAPCSVEIVRTPKPW